MNHTFVYIQTSHFILCSLRQSIYCQSDQTQSPLHEIYLSQKQYIGWRKVGCFMACVWMTLKPKVKGSESYRTGKIRWVVYTFHLFWETRAVQRWCHQDLRRSLRPNIFSGEGWLGKNGNWNGGWQEVLALFRWNYYYWFGWWYVCKWWGDFTHSPTPRQSVHTALHRIFEIFDTPHNCTHLLNHHPRKLSHVKRVR